MFFEFIMFVYFVWIRKIVKIMFRKYKGGLFDMVVETYK